MDPVHTAVSLFAQGFSCSQSLLLAFAPRFGLDPAMAARLASPFGGGIARQGRVCVGRELELGYRLFCLRQKISPEDLDALVWALNTPSIRGMIEEHGDMDRPGDLIRRLLMNPSVVCLLRPLLKAGLHTLF